MSIIKQDYGEVGGGKQTSWYFSTSAMQNATDQNPIIIYGDFSNVNKLLRYGQYSSSDAGNPSWGDGLNVDDPYPIIIGQKTKMYISWSGNYNAWRYITVYNDRIEIGSGAYSYYYQTPTIDSNYGLLQYLAIFNGTPDY